MKVIGNLKSYQLYYPGLPPELLIDIRAGATLDLGDTELVFFDAAIRDLPDTLWVYDRRRRAMFVSDALGFYHYHDEHQCAMSVEELPEQPTRQQIAVLNEQALYWARYTDFRAPFDRMDELMRRFPVDVILPAHGNIVTDPASTVPVIRDELIASVDAIAVGAGLEED
jgi:flavorubredoxin